MRPRRWGCALPAQMPSAGGCRGVLRGRAPQCRQPAREEHRPRCPSTGRERSRAGVGPSTRSSDSLPNCVIPKGRRSPRRRGRSATLALGDSLASRLRRLDRGSVVATPCGGDSTLARAPAATSSGAKRRPTSGSWIAAARSRVSCWDSPASTGSCGSGRSPCSTRGSPSATHIGPSPIKGSSVEVMGRILELALGSQPIGSARRKADEQPPAHRRPARVSGRCIG